MRTRGSSRARAASSASTATRPGTPSAASTRGLHATWPATHRVDWVSPLDATVVLEFVGTEDLAFAPIGEQSRFKLGSDWPHPSFNGRFLPAQRTVNAQGLQAEWRLSALASRAGQELVEGRALCAPGETLAAPAAAGRPGRPILGQAAEGARPRRAGPASK